MPSFVLLNQNTTVTKEVRSKGLIQGSWVTPKGAIYIFICKLDRRYFSKHTCVIWI